MRCKLALEDGTVFTGVGFGATGTHTGEVVFNTAMTGYQEIFTDPSYCGQIVTMTFPLLGNYGVNDIDDESAGTHLSGVVLKELPKRPSNFRSSIGLPEFLAARGIIGLAGVDTRALTRRTRVHGALRGVLSTEIASDLELVNLARQSAPMSGANLVGNVVTPEISTWERPLDRLPGDPEAVPAESSHIVVLDCGVKRNILRYLVEHDCRVTVVPADTAAAKIRDLAPDGLLVGNGPGDPAAVTGTIETLRELLGSCPIFGICLGHQLLALALGAKTHKLKFGHHGANLPVLNEPAGRVEITSQNHGFVVDRDSLAELGGVPTHINLNDQSLEGFVHPDYGVAAVQFHPEASPGPHDAGYLFRRFAETVRAKQNVDAQMVV